MEYIDKPIHGSLEWLELRHKHNGITIVGASEVSAVMGVNKYKNIIDLAIEKLQPVQLREQNDAMKRGTFLEQGLIDYASAELGVTITTPAVMYLNGRIISTLDGLAGHQVFEAKTTTAWVAGDDCLPEWFWQAQAQMYCTDAPKVTFIVLDRSLRISMFDVARDEEAIAEMITRVNQFCESIDAGELPEEMPLTAEQVNKLHPEPAGELQLTPAHLELISRWQSTKAQLKEIETEEENLKNQIADLMRDKEAASIDGQRILTYKAQSRSSFDTKRFTEANPEMAKEYTTTRTFRVMRTVKGTF